MPLVYSKAPFKHCKRATTVFPFLSANKKYREEDPFSSFKFKLKANKSQTTTVFSMFYSRSYCNILKKM